MVAVKNCCKKNLDKQKKELTLREKKYIYLFRLGG